MELSKLALLMRPLTFHTANHEAIVLWCSVGAAGYLLFDSMLYLTLGNIYYCHPPTLNRALEVLHINMSSAINMSESEIHVSVFHRSVDTFLTLTFGVITLINTVFQCKRNSVADIPPQRPVLQEFSNQRNQENVVSNLGQSENAENLMQVPGHISEANIQNIQSRESSSSIENQGSINLPSYGHGEIQMSRPNASQEESVRFSDAKSKSGPTTIYHQQTLYHRLDQSNLVTVLQIGDGLIVKDISTNPGQEVIMRPRILLSEDQSCDETLISHDEVEEITIIPGNLERKYDKVLNIPDVNPQLSGTKSLPTAQKETIDGKPTPCVSEGHSGNPKIDSRTSSTTAQKETSDVEPTVHISEGCSGNPQIKSRKSLTTAQKEPIDVDQPFLVSEEHSGNQQLRSKTSSTTAQKETIDAEPTIHISKGCSGNPQIRSRKSFTTAQKETADVEPTFQVSEEHSGNQQLSSRTSSTSVQRETIDPVSEGRSNNPQIRNKKTSTIAQRETINVAPTFLLSEGHSGNPQCDSTRSQFSLRVILILFKTLLSEISYGIFFFIFLYGTSIIIKLASFSRNGYLCYEVGGYIFHPTIGASLILTLILPGDLKIQMCTSTSDTCTYKSIFLLVVL